MTTQKTKITVTTEDLVGVPQAAKELGVNFSTVYRWIKKGIIRPFRIGGQVYITVEDVKVLKEARGHELRELLQVGDDSVLKSRAFRNHFEHFDERLDKWINSPKRKNFADSNIGPPGFISGLDPKDWMRNLDPTCLTLTFHGDSYSIPEIMGALKPICAAAQHKAQGLLWTE